MTRDEYEQSKARIREQHRAAVELLDAACSAQLRALDLVWMIQGGGSGAAANETVAAPAAPPAKQTAPAPAPPRRKSSPEVENDIVQAYGKLPETFTRNDVCKVLGYEPERGALYRSLMSLVERELIRVEERGSGRVAALYRRTPKKPAADA